MSKVRFIACSSVIALLVSITVCAQQPKPRTSPHETTNARINGKLVTIHYGRPYSKNPKGGEIRKIWGGLVPYGSAWRLGADEATLLTTQVPLTFGSTTIPAGAYTLYMVPEENGGKLAFSKALGAWGIPVNEKEDQARVDLKKEKLDPAVDQLQITVSANPPSGGIIKINWEGATYSAAFTTGGDDGKKAGGGDAKK